jgi:hypothetical protein
VTLLSIWKQASACDAKQFHARGLENRTMAQSNLDRFKGDLERLITTGELLHEGLQYETNKEGYKEAVEHEPRIKDKETFLNNLPHFASQYQSWYSEALAVIRQILPDRLHDFVRQYEKPKAIRKSIDFENYTIEDGLQGLRVTRGWNEEVVVSKSAAVPRFRQQLEILKAVQQRFNSSLFDIRQLVQADIFDSELEAARELLKHRFVRAAGAVAGVVLEKHLAEVCDSHQVKISKKNPTVGDYNDALKNEAVIETPQWRFIQHLGDVRNLCDHDKKKEPTTDQVEGLISGVEKLTKTLF